MYLERDGRNIFSSKSFFQEIQENGYLITAKD